MADFTIRPATTTTTDIPQRLIERSVRGLVVALAFLAVIPSGICF